MTALEDRLYLALLGARTVVAAQVAVNPAQFRVLDLVDKVAAEYKAKQAREERIHRAITEDEETDAARE